MSPYLHIRSPQIHIHPPDVTQSIHSLSCSFEGDAAHLPLSPLAIIVIGQSRALCVAFGGVLPLTRPRSLRSRHHLASLITQAIRLGLFANAGCSPVS